MRGSDAKTELARTGCPRQRVRSRVPHRSRDYDVTINRRRSMSGPPAVDRDRRAGDRDRVVAAEEGAQRADLSRLDEALRRHRVEEGALEGLLFGDAAAVGGNEAGGLSAGGGGHLGVRPDSARGDAELRAL